MGTAVRGEFGNCDTQRRDADPGAMPGEIGALVGEMIAREAAGIRPGVTISGIFQLIIVCDPGRGYQGRPSQLTRIPAPLHRRIESGNRVFFGSDAFTIDE